MYPVTRNTTHIAGKSYAGTGRLTNLVLCKGWRRRRKEKEAKILKRIINLSSLKTTRTVVLQIKERIGKVKSQNSSKKRSCQITGFIPEVGNHSQSKNIVFVETYL